MVLSHPSYMKVFYLKFETSENWHNKSEDWILSWIWELLFFIIWIEEKKISHFLDIKFLKHVCKNCVQTWLSKFLNVSHKGSVCVATLSIVINEPLVKENEGEKFWSQEL